MYAVIKAGGKQHKVKPGDVIEVELIGGGRDEVTFAPLLVVDDGGKAHFGKDLDRAVVRGRLLGEQKGDKVRVFKYRPKTGYSKRQGHRQTYTLVEIQDVSLRPGAGEVADSPSGTGSSEAPRGATAEAAPPEPGGGAEARS